MPQGNTQAQDCHRDDNQGDKINKSIHSCLLHEGPLNKHDDGSRHFKPHFFPLEFLNDPKALAERIRLVIAKAAPVVPPPKPVPSAPVTSGTVVRVQYGQGAIPDTATPRTRAEL